METVTGVTVMPAEAQRVARVLDGMLSSASQVSCLVPGRAGDTVPTTDAEAPGVGRPLGAVVGGAAGGAAGIAVAAHAFPGAGPVLALGALALGAGGAVAGVVIADRLDDALELGLPRDELYVYRDALRQGHGIVLVRAASDLEAERARAVLEREGVESIDAARERWWLGLRDAEREHYAPHGAFEPDEARYRSGFDAGLREASSWPDAGPGGGPVVGDPAMIARLREHHGALADDPAFRHGYTRGAAYARGPHGFGRWPEAREPGDRPPPDAT
jgi:hypothetical protein